MEVLKIENLSFIYPNRENKAIDEINLTVKKGEFITVCGKSGCGKTTLLRLLKPTISPHGKLSGNILFEDKSLIDVDICEQASKIGFVMQSPDNQIVTDKVWHELAFGLESLGYSTTEIRTRVSEMASFFGIQSWFHKNVTELSGGQKQILNLASVMVMQPTLLILDEPTAQLDPIAASDFLNALEKINRELGTTIILSEHRLEETFTLSDRIIVIDNGRIIAEDTPQKVGEILKSKNHDMYLAMPTPIRIYGSVENDLSCPVTVREGRVWLEEFVKCNTVNSDVVPISDEKHISSETAIEIKDVWFRYERNLPDIIKNLNLEIKKGELFAIVGGNGTGKSTALSLISGLNEPYRGTIAVNGKSISEIKDLNNGIVGVLPQNPQSLFVKKTVYLDLLDILTEANQTVEEKNLQIKQIATLCHIDNLLDSHPYDLSGGEQQRAALAKILLLSPQILLLDEPTKGFDAHFKNIFADILQNLKSQGITIVMVSHDIEFCAEYADRCAMFFDGNITSCGTPREFFGGKSFYTTAANRMARTTIKSAVLPNDIILALGGDVKENETFSQPISLNRSNVISVKSKDAKLKISPVRIILGVVFLILFILTSACIFSDFPIPGYSGTFFAELDILHFAAIIEIILALICIFPEKMFSSEILHIQKGVEKNSKRTILTFLLICLIIPLTIYFGIYFFGERKYFFISLLVMIETIIPFCMAFEGRKPKARELVIISVLCALAVAGRAAFFMLPQFKPVIAIIIVSGLCFGGETGFLVGTTTGFVSNFFFGQGPWTMWQMFVFGIIGFLSGIFFKNGFIKVTKMSLTIFGFVITLVIYGGIMNPASVIMWQSKITSEMIISSYIAGLPFDMIHALSTALFLWIVSKPMIEKLERIKKKYGLIEK